MVVAIETAGLVALTHSHASALATLQDVIGWSALRQRPLNIQKNKFVDSGLPPAPNFGGTFPTPKF